MLHFCTTYRKKAKKKQKQKTNKATSNIKEKLLKTAASFQPFLHVTVALLWLYK